MSSLELDRAKHAKRRVSALAVMEDLEVLEDRIGQLHPGPPVAAMMYGWDAAGLGGWWMVVGMGVFALVVLGSVG